MDLEDLKIIFLIPELSTKFHYSGTFRYSTTVVMSTLTGLYGSFCCFRWVVRRINLLDTGCDATHTSTNHRRYSVTMPTNATGKPIERWIIIIKSISKFFITGILIGTISVHIVLLCEVCVPM